MENLKETNHSNKNQENTVQAVDRAITLLKMIAESSTPLLINELVERTGMNRTTTWRLLATLEAHDFIERDSMTKGYQIGYSFSNLSLGETKYDTFVRRARPSMEQLMEDTNETVILSVPNKLGVLSVDQIDSPHSVRIVNYVDTTLPLHCTSNGKLLLSHLPKEEVDIILQRTLERMTPFTITDPNLLRSEIDRVKERGFGTSFGELDESENGVSAPIRGKDNRLIGFISVSGPSFRLSRERIFELAPRVISTAEEIAKNLEK